MPVPQTAQDTTQNLTNQIFTVNMPVIDLQEAYVASLQLNVTASNIPAQSFPATNVNTGSPGTITITAHGFVQGLAVQFTNSGGSLPTGISALTNYFVKVIDVNTIGLYDTLAHAQTNGSTGRINITMQGSGTDTATPQALSSATIAAFASNDGVNFVALSGLTSTLTGSTTVLYRLGTIDYRYIQLQYTAASTGGISLAVIENMMPAWGKTV